MGLPEALVPTVWNDVAAAIEDYLIDDMIAELDAI